MTTEQAEVVLDYFNKGYIVLIDDTPYVDNVVKSMYEEDGRIVYCSEHFDDRPLSESDLEYVIIAQPVKSLSSDDSIEYVGDEDNYYVENFNKERL